MGAGRLTDGTGKPRVAQHSPRWTGVAEPSTPGDKRSGWSGWATENNFQHRKQDSFSISIKWAFRGRQTWYGRGPCGSGGIFCKSSRRPARSVAVSIGDTPKLLLSKRLVMAHSPAMSLCPKIPFKYGLNFPKLQLTFGTEGLVVQSERLCGCAHCQVSSA